MFLFVRKYIPVHVKHFCAGIPENKVEVAPLTLCTPMGFPIKFANIQSGGSIVYVEGSRVVISKKIVLLSLKINYVLENSADIDEMPYSLTFYRCLHCLAQYPFSKFRYTEGLD